MVVVSVCLSLRCRAFHPKERTDFAEQKSVCSVTEHAISMIHVSTSEESVQRTLKSQCMRDGLDVAESRTSGLGRRRVQPRRSARRPRRCFGCRSLRCRSRHHQTCRANRKRWRDGRSRVPWGSRRV
jgi:hypothetical protein